MNRHVTDAHRALVGAVPEPNTGAIAAPATPIDLDTLARLLAEATPGQIPECTCSDEYYEDHGHHTDCPQELAYYARATARTTLTAYVISNAPELLRLARVGQEREEQTCGTCAEWRGYDTTYGRCVVRIGCAWDATEHCSRWRAKEKP